jgi:hypothetical protein
MEHIFEIRINFNNTLHEDIVFNFPSLQKNELIDSYYYLLGSNEMTEIELKKKLLFILIEWKNKLYDVKIIDKFYLPVDLSDEYICGFYIEKGIDLFSVKYVCIRGAYSLNIKSVMIELDGLEFIELYNFNCTQLQFIASVENSINIFSRS